MNANRARKTVRVSDEEIVASYRETGNVWKTAEQLGISGQTVSRRMKNAGIPTNKNWVTPAVKQAVLSYYKDTPSDIFDLNSFAATIGYSVVTIGKVAQS